MTINANSAGVLTGKFIVPEGIPAGNKRVVFLGGGGSRGEAVFSGQGTLLRQTFRQETTTTETRWWSPPPPPPPPAPAWWDPLAQTFTLDQSAQVGGVDLWFTASGTSTVVVQIRETTAGVPNQTVLAEARILPAAINTTGGATRIPFAAPLALRASQEYAIVVLCDDAQTALAIAELGKWDNAAGRWVTSQPYQVGVLLSSSNANTWTPHQDRDIAFRLLKASYTETERQIALGQVSVTNATDLLLLAYAEQPSAQATASYRLTLPDGSQVDVADGQPVRLPTPITGVVGVSARLKGTADSSPILYPGSQLIAGEIATSADYVTRAIPAGSNTRVRVIFDAIIPGGAAVNVSACGIDAGDNWQAVPYQGATPNDDGWQEISHELLGINESAIRVRLTLTGNAAARPRVRNLRVLTT